MKIIYYVIKDQGRLRKSSFQGDHDGPDLLFYCSETKMKAETHFMKIWTMAIILWQQIIVVEISFTFSRALAGLLEWNIMIKKQDSKLSTMKIRSIFEVVDAVPIWFTYRTLRELMLPSLWIAQMLGTNYKLQGRSRTMMKTYYVIIKLCSTFSKPPNRGVSVTILIRKSRSKMPS